MTHNFESTDKGLRIITDYMDGIETVSLSVLVKTGSRHEAKEINGISHFLEHMAFKGTETRTARQIAEEFDMIGGKFNAYTDRERTVYHAKVLKNDWKKAINILADILQNSVFDQKELDSERSVILQEIAQTNDAADDIVFDFFQEAAFPNQPIGRPILGPAEFIKNVSREQFIKYINDRYGYNNMIVAAAGNIKHQDFIAEVRALFNKLPSHSDAQFQEARYAGGESRTERKDLEQVHLLIGFKGLSYLDDDYYTQQVLAIITGGGMSSRLFQEIREKRGLAYHVSAFSSSYADSGIFGVYSATSEVQASELIEATAGELLDMTYNINSDELQRAKVQLKGGLLMAQESSMARAERIASNYALFGRLIPVEEMIAKIEAIEVKSVHNMMSNIFSQKGNLTFAAIGKIATIYDYEVISSKFKA